MASMDCLWVLMPITQDGWDVDAMSIGIAVAIGLIVGALIALGCWKLCLNDIMRQKVRQIHHRTNLLSLS
jgi:hypothetical protein